MSEMIESIKGYMDHWTTTGDDGTTWAGYWLFEYADARDEGWTDTELEVWAQTCLKYVTDHCAAPQGSGIPGQAYNDRPMITFQGIDSRRRARMVVRITQYGGLDI